MIKLADGRGSLYQWDTGRQVECDAEQVHFSNHHYGTSIDVDVQNGKATIPNQLLTSAIPIKAWAWVKDSNGEYTKEEQIFIVAKRNKPSDYVYTPTEIKTWQDLQNQIGDLNSLTTAHKDNLVNAINDAAGSGGGASDFIIKMTVKANGDNYTVISCDATVEQIDAAFNADKNIVLIVAKKGETNKYVLSLTYAMPEFGYLFESFYDTYFLIANIDKADGAYFVMTETPANAVGYSNAALPSISTVEEALNELVPKSHTHGNKSVLDKFAETDGKLQYNGQALNSDGGTLIIKCETTATAIDGSSYRITAIEPSTEDILEAFNAGKQLVIKAHVNDNYVWLPLINYTNDDMLFGAFIDGQTVLASLAESYIELRMINAEVIEYVYSSTNDVDWLSNSGNVGGTLDDIIYEVDTLDDVSFILQDDVDKLTKQSHTHDNKAVLDLISATDGKLKYNGSDVGLKPVKGTDYWTPADKQEIVADTLAALPKWTGSNY